MEVTKASAGTLMRRYWKGRKLRKLAVATLGSGGRTRRSWKVRIIPKLVAVASPMKLLTKVKNTYVNIMVNLTGNVGSLNDRNAFRSKRVVRVPESRRRVTTEEVEQRLVYEIYLAFKGSRDFVPPVSIV